VVAASCTQILRRMFRPAAHADDRLERARLWRDITVARLVSMIGLTVSLLMVELDRPPLVWAMLGFATLQIPVFIALIRRTGVLRPVFALIDVLALAAVAFVEPDLLMHLGLLVVATAAYSASTFGRQVGIVIGAVGLLAVLGPAAWHRPEGWISAVLVTAVGLNIVVLICGRAAAVAGEMRRRVDDILESVDAVIWESPGTQIAAEVIYGPNERLFGWPIEEYRDDFAWEDLIHPDDRGVCDISRAALAAGTPYRMRYRFRTKHGGYRWVQDDIDVVTNERGQVTHRRGLSRDISNVIAADLAAERYVQFVESLPLGVLMLELVDEDDATSFVIVAANTAIDRFGPRPLSDAVGRRLIEVRPEVFDPTDSVVVAESVADAVRRGRSIHHDHLDLTAMGVPGVHASLRIIPLPGNHVAVVCEDITEMVAARSQLESLAYRDPLTQLPNRTALHDDLTAALSAAVDDGGDVTLALLDLDQFKEVNDAFGHSLGDELLVSVARALEQCAPAGATVARLSGDEFAVVTRTNATDAARLGDLLRGAFERPLTLAGGLTLQASPSIGLASFPTQADSVATLLQRADVAMYLAKRSSCGSAVYAPELDRSSARRVTLLGELRGAIDDGELTLHYQPIVDVGSGMIHRVEGLIRWDHRELGLLAPAEFIELAELNNLNRGVVRSVVRQALDTLAQWHAAGWPIGVSINIAGSSLADSDLMAEIVTQVRAAGVPRLSFGLELTERQLLLDTQASMRSFELLAEAGVWISIDDFGTGASSLWALREIPARELKIDRTFVEDLRRGDGTLLRSIVAMSHDLGLKVVAEGVEDEVTYRWLRDSGCDYVQGYLLARPMPAWQAELLFGAPLRPANGGASVAGAS